MEEPRRILFVSAFETPFIRRDLDFLSAHHTVNALIGSGPAQALRVLQAAGNTDVIFSWFASVYGALAVLHGRIRGARTIIQVGGVDIANDPHAGYGLWRSRWKGALVGRALRSADSVLVVDDSLRQEVIGRAGYDGRNIETLPTGFSRDQWKADTSKRPVVLTVAHIPDLARVRIKGLDTLLDAARKAPDVRFEVVGVSPDVMKHLSIPANVDCISWMPQADVARRMGQSSVYCQPSRREGLSNALCEAMLSECVPVVTNVGGNAHAIGDTGVVVPSDDPSSLAEAVRRAMTLQRDNGRRARTRVIELFDESKRWKRLRELIEGPPNQRPQTRV